MLKQTAGRTSGCNWVGQLNKMIGNGGWQRHSRLLEELSK